jgi:hypothetical protein
MSYRLMRELAMEPCDLKLDVRMELRVPHRLPQPAPPLPA